MFHQEIKGENTTDRKNEYRSGGQQRVSLCLDRMTSCMQDPCFCVPGSLPLTPIFLPSSFALISKSSFLLNGLYGNAVRPRLG